MEAFRDRFAAAELLSYKEVLFEEATEDWYAQHYPDQVDREECNVYVYLNNSGISWKSTENGSSPMYSFTPQHEAWQHI